MKASQKCSLDEQTILFSSNHLQVTGQNIGLIFDLNQNEPSLVKMIEDMDELIDPERYLESGFTVKTNASHTSCKNHTYGISTSLEVNA